MAEQGTRLEGGTVEIVESGRLSVESTPNGDDIYSLIAEQIDVTRWRPQLEAGVDMTEFALAGGGSYYIVGNADRSVHLRLTPGEVDVLTRLDGDTTIGELIVDQLSEDGELDSADIVNLVKLVQSKSFLVERPVDVFEVLERALHPPTFASRLDRFARTLTIEWSGAERAVTRLYRTVFRYTFNPIAAVAAS